MVVKLYIVEGSGKYYGQAELLAAGEYLGAGRPGFFYGHGAARLGLPYVVPPIVHKRLCRGESPDGKRKLVQTAGRPDRPGRKGRDPGREIQFAWDKSLSAVYATATPVWRAALLLALQSAVCETLDEISKKAALTRRGKGGVLVERGDLVFAIYIHFTNRNHDTHVHVHSCLYNLVVRADGTVGSLDNRKLYGLQSQLDSIFNATLVSRLSALGLDVKLRDGICVVPGVPPALLSDWSSRRKEIKEALRSADPNDRHAGDKVARSTRARKKVVPEKELQERWRADAARHGFDVQTVCRPEPIASVVERLRRASNAVKAGLHQGQSTTPTVNSPAAPGHAKPKVPTQKRKPSTPSKSETTEPKPIRKGNAGDAPELNRKKNAAPVQTGARRSGELASPDQRQISQTEKPHQSPPQSQGVTQAVNESSTATGHVPRPLEPPPKPQPSATVVPETKATASAATAQTKAQAVQVQQAMPQTTNGTHGTTKRDERPMVGLANRSQSVATHATSHPTGNGASSPHPALKRQAKPQSQPRPQSKDVSVGQAASPGHTELVRVRHAVVTRLPTPLTHTVRIPRPREASSWVKEAVRELKMRQAAFGPVEIVGRARSIAERQAPDVSPDAAASAVLSACCELRKNPSRHGLRVINRDPAAPVYTTKAQMRLERKVLSIVKRLRRDKGHVIPPSDVNRTLALHAPYLSEGQKVVIRKIAESKSCLTLVAGAQRSGRTTVADAIAGVLRQSDYQVFVLSPTARGARQLGRHSQAPAMTLAALTALTKKPGVFKTWWNVYKAVRKHQFRNLNALLRYAQKAHRSLKEPLVRLDRKSAVIIDNAEAATTADLKSALSRAARAGAQVIMIGDPHGLPAPAPGGLFRHLVKSGVDATLPIPKHAIPRGARAATEAICQGDNGAAISELEKGNCLSVSPKLVAAAGGNMTESPSQRLVKEFLSRRRTGEPGETVILADRRAYADGLNRLVQKQRLGRGLLGENKMTVGGVDIYATERVRFTSSVKELDVRASDTGTVRAITKEHVEISLDDGRRLLLPKIEKTPIQLGYALTPEQAREKTCRHAFIYAGSPLRSADVAATLLCRATDSVCVFADEELLKTRQLVRPLASVEATRMARDYVYVPPPPVLQPAPQPTPQYTPRLGY